MSDLTTIDDVNGWLGLKPGNADEQTLQRLITAASGFVETWCNRVFAVDDYQEVYDGTGGGRLVLRNAPIVAVSSLMVDGKAVPASPGFGRAGYSFSRTAITLTYHRFTHGLGNVAVSYAAGFATIPAEVAQATIDLIALRWRERDRIGMSSKGMAGETTAFTVRDMPPQVATLLANYRRVTPA